jgi:bacillithiol system protein YtxJ
MAWIKLNSQALFERLIADSKLAPQFVFKHSVRCSISAMALNRLQESSKKMNIYIIDVINNRDISNEVEKKFDVRHQSPQLLVVIGGNCKYHTSHMGVTSSVLDQFFSAQA